MKPQLKCCRIIFRAFQGLGGGGNFALGTIVFLELVPMESYPTYTSGVSIVFSMSLLIGPIIGGALNHADTWRWVFLLKSVQPCIVCLECLLWTQCTNWGSLYRCNLDLHAIRVSISRPRRAST
jgi:MFS family permease